MIYLIDDDEILSECLENSLKKVFKDLRLKKFTNAIDAINTMRTDEEKSILPKLILLDVMLIGPNGFTMLNELASYPTTAKIPIIVISSLNLQKFNLKNYNIVKTFDKSVFTPAELISEIEKYVQQ